MTDSKKVALVTGGSRGIGAAISRRLAKDGYFVLINFARNESAATEVLAAIKADGGAGALCGFDVSDPVSISGAFKKLTTEYGPLSVLVNNAGITIDSLLMRLREEDLERTLSVDLKGAIFCTKEAVRPMMKAKSGSIIQISSVVGESGNAGQSAYCAAKAGLIGFSKAVAKELASRRIRVNVVTPGFIKTDMTEALTEDQKGSILQTIPLGCLGLPEDVAGVVSFLASSDSRYVTGQVIGVNGGMYM